MAWKPSRLRNALLGFALGFLVGFGVTFALYGTDLREQVGLFPRLMAGVVVGAIAALLMSLSKPPRE